jgi:hypothetical protein
MLYFRSGVGGFMRLGYYRHPKLEDNAALKMSITLSFK